MTTPPTRPYSIESGDPDGLFVIDSASGALSYQGPGEDYESGPTSHELTVRASDGTGHSDVTVVVDITDVPEQEIIEAPAGQTVSEPAGEDFSRNVSTAGRIVVGDTATGNIGIRRDRDWFAVELEADREYRIDLRGSHTGDGTLRDPYLRGIHDAEGNLISGTTDDDGGVDLNSRMTFTPTETGTYYIAAGAFSGHGTYELEVRDISPQTAQQETVNGSPAFASASYAFALDENAAGDPVPVALGLVQATDPDDDPVVYSMEGGNADGLFAIDSATGELSYLGPGEDYESGATSHELTVRASDGTGHSDVTVTVYVGDVEEYVILEQTANEAPQFTSASYAFALDENAAGGTVPVSLGVVQATDPGNDPVVYSIEAGNSDGLFAIDSATGELSYLGPGEDYEAGPTSYELTVRASDGTGRSDVTVTINVTDDADEEEHVSLQQEVSVSEPDGQDLPADVSTTGAVAVGGSATGEIDDWNDFDWFAVTLGAGKTYRIDLEGSRTGAGTLYNPYLRGIYDADGDRISGTSNHDGGAYTNSRVNFTATQDATYYVAAGASGGVEGTYTLSVTEVADDYAAGTETSGAVVVGGSARGEIETPNDRDWFAVTLESGKTYRIDLEGSPTGAGTLSDPYLYGIHDANGNRILGTVNDDGGARYNSRVFFTATENATYYVAASGLEDLNLTGTYSLSVTDVTVTFMDDFTAGTSGAVVVGGSATGEIETPNDRDWFAVTLKASTTYRIDLKGSWTEAGTLIDPYLYGIHDAEGNLLSGTVSHAGGEGYNSRVFFTAMEDATYYVAAGAYGNLTGTYTVSVTEVVDDDYAAGTGTSGAVVVGGSANGEIEYWNDRDWFAVTLQSGKTYRIDLEGSPTGVGTLSDPYLRGIHDADGNLLSNTTNHDGGMGYNSRVSSFTATENATYYVVAGARGHITGTYALSVTEAPDDYAAGMGTSGAVVVGGSATGEIEYWNDRDWFAVILAAGKTYRIDLEGSPTGAGTLINPYLYGIHDAEGNLLSGTVNDDGGAGYNSRVSWFTATENATYYVAAGARGYLTGTYTLSVTEVADDYAVGTGTSGAVVVGGPAIGEIEAPNDRDWFTVTLAAGKTYRIDLEGSPTGAGTLIDPYLYGIHDAEGNLLSGTVNDDGGAGYNSRVSWFTATEDATYYVAAGARGYLTGTYTLSVTEAPDDYAAGTGTSGAVVVGGSSTGEIDYRNDRDWFAVTLAAGKTYRIDLEGWPTGAGTLPDPYLYGIHDAAGDFISGTTDDNGGSVYNSRVFFTATEEATYYVAAGVVERGAYTGTYTLSVEEVM